MTILAPLAASLTPPILWGFAALATGLLAFTLGRASR